MSDDSQRLQLPRHRFILAGAMLALVIGTGITLWMWRVLHPPLSIPITAAEKALFSLYLPTSLPQGYKLNPDSYDTSEGVLLFSATDENGHAISFSEQPKPKDFDIAAFQQRLTQPKNLPGTLYPSVIGKDETGTTVLSAQADTTWLLITTKTPDAETTLKFIAHRLKKQ